MSDIQTQDTGSTSTTGPGSGPTKGPGKETNRVRVLEAMTSLLDARAKLAGVFGHGLGFLGKRNYYTSFGYPQRVESRDFWELFARQNISRRIVVAPVAATWVRPPRVLFKSDRAQQRWDKLEADRKLNIWFQLARLDVLCGLGDFAILFISMGDKDPSKPARKVNRRKLPLYFAPYSQISTTIEKYDSDISSENYGKPLMYKINPNNSYQKEQSASLEAVTTSTIKDVSIHYTRVIHAAEEAYDNDSVSYTHLTLPTILLV